MALLPSASTASASATVTDSGRGVEPPRDIETPPQPITRFATAGEEHDDFDNDLLLRAVKDAGRWAFGTVFVEVWVLNDSKTHLYRPQNGWWVDPVYQASDDEHLLTKLVDPEHPDYIAAHPLAPGCGLPGALWAGAQRGSTVRFGGQSQRAVTNLSERSNAGTAETPGNAQFDTSNMATRILWREVRPLADDPDQPYNPRMIHMANCRLGWAAGVPFQMGGNEGIVVYMARDTIDFSRLSSPTNESYLMHATLLIGAAYGLRGPRQASVDARKAELRSTLKRVKAKLRAVMKFGAKALEALVESESTRFDATNPDKHPSMHLGTKLDGSTDDACTDVTNLVIHKAKSSYQKFFGANVRGPPFFMWDQAIWSFISAFISLLVITNISKALVDEHGKDFAVVLGPFGALMTLQYGLTAAPASQPRNALVGQFLSLVISQSIAQLDSVEPWLRQSLATALAVGVMVKLGITHPPAGAAALLFSTGRFTWNQVWIMLMANAVAVVLATLLNNFNDKRQYPTFWGFRPIRELLGMSDDDDSKKKKVA